MNYSYETTGNNSYLVARAEGGREIINFQLQMLINNDIKNILKTFKRQSDDDVLIYYNITSRIALSQALGRERLSKRSLITMISLALDAIDDLHEYSLPSGGVRFDADMIYLRPGTDDIQFAYIPDSTSESGVDALKALILDLIMKGKIENTGDDFIQVMLSELNSPVFSTGSLRKLCASILTADEAKKRVIDYIPEKKVEAPVEKPVIPEPVHEELPESRVRKPEIPSDNRREDKPADKTGKPEKRGKKFPLKSVMIGCTAGVCLIAAVVPYLLKADILTIVGIVILAAAIMLLISKKLLEKQGENSAPKKQPAAKKSAAKPLIPGEDTRKAAVPPMPGRAEEKVAAASDLAPASPEARYSAPKVSEPVRQYEDRARRNDFIDDNGSDETEVFIPEESSREAYLEYTINGVQKRIPLAEGSVIVGKLSSQCDVAVEDSKVSKVHAEFINRGGKYFVRDCNSKNGTYINGSTQRIQSNVEYQINFGDCISLADLRMTLKIR